MPDFDQPSLILAAIEADEPAELVGDLGKRRAPRWPPPPKEAGLRPARVQCRTAGRTPKGAQQPVAHGHSHPVLAEGQARFGEPGRREGSA